MTQLGRPWRDRLSKAPLDPDAVARETGVRDVFDWIRLFNGFQSELPEPFAVIEVLGGPNADVACEALRALKRNPKLVDIAAIDMASNRLWNVNPILHDIMMLTYPGTAVDFGCGAGRDSVWLAANGWEVTAVDRLEGNLDALRKLRAAYAPNDPIHWVLANLDDFQPESRFDLVLLHYCWDPRYFEFAKKCLAPGGLLSILAHSAKHIQCFGTPRASKVLVPGDLNTAGLEIIRQEEFWALDRHAIWMLLRG